MFGQVYVGHDDERPKYGTPNIYNDPFGIFSASQYGTSYMVLHPEVRKRCTTTSVDSSYKSYGQGSIDNPLSMLASLDDEQLQATIDAMESPNPIANNSKHNKIIIRYSEIQIHGGLDLRTDINAIYLCCFLLLDKKNG
eukprot:TRINITY_DN7239_c0_g1_i1.p1 TRINITY_DN7239_c0_g1~~TRINITY_DN7239_c0_g1_i1.p1  ORF type:complete len:139 (-),score=16.97 TRINITY_DN7239_c0_g1_i1:892-1308(-)